jgi:hypothetical protein
MRTGIRRTGRVRLALLSAAALGATGAKLSAFTEGTVSGGVYLPSNFITSNSDNISDSGTATSGAITETASYVAGAFQQSDGHVASVAHLHTAMTVATNVLFPDQAFDACTFATTLKVVPNNPALIGQQFNVQATYEAIGTANSFGGALLLGAIDSHSYVSGSNTSWLAGGPTFDATITSIMSSAIGTLGNPVSINYSVSQTAGTAGQPKSGTTFVDTDIYLKSISVSLTSASSSLTGAAGAAIVLDSSQYTVLYGDPTSPFVNAPVDFGVATMPEPGCGFVLGAIGACYLPRRRRCNKMRQ